MIGKIKEVHSRTTTDKTDGVTGTGERGVQSSLSPFLSYLVCLSIRVSSPCFKRRDLHAFKHAACREINKWRAFVCGVYAEAKTVKDHRSLSVITECRNTAGRE